MKIYLAGALFSTAEKNFNYQLKLSLTKLNPMLDVLLPQEQAQKIIGEDNFEDKVFNYCISGVIESDVVLAILEGPDIDSGTCVELGIAFAHKKKIIGVRTDFRGSEFKGLNIMVYKVLDYYIYQHLKDNEIDGLALQIKSVLDEIMQKN